MTATSLLYNLVQKFAGLTRKKGLENSISTEEQKADVKNMTNL